MSWSEAKWVLDNIVQKIGQPPNDMRKLTAFSVSGTSIGLQFLEPEDSYADGNLICTVEGVMIRMGEDDYPKGPTDGTLIIDNKDLGAYEATTFIVEGLEQSKDYYFAAFPYSAAGVYNVTGSEANRAKSVPEDFTATIDVTYPEGAVLTCSQGDTVYTAETTTGAYQFTVHMAGTWTLKAADGKESESVEVTVTTDGESVSTEIYFAKIYGISRDITLASPVWARTDDAVGFLAFASSGTFAGASNFDDAMPWAGMERETLDTGDVMVKIPKFWFQRYREGNVEYIKIADRKKSGFAVHPLFVHAGVECDHAYVGAYKTSDGHKSVSGAAPLANLTRGAFRDGAKGKGAGWSLMDIAALSAVQMLILVEYATNDAQSAIGRGYCDKTSGGSAINVGSCDSVPNLTGKPAGTDGLIDVVYRGIEGFWGNVFEWIDGVNINDGKYYVCNDISKYADDTSENYEELSYAGATNWSGSYITEEGVDEGNNPHVMLPAAAGSGSESTYYCDYCYSSTGWRVLCSGGYWNAGSGAGLFYASLNYASTYYNTPRGARLLYIPS